MDGSDKLKLLVVGKSKQLRRFKGETDEEGEPVSESEEYLRLEQGIQCREIIGADDDDIVETVIAKRRRSEEYRKSGSEDEPNTIPLHPNS